MLRRDVFISHASEDAAAIARPLAQELVRRGLSVWFDEYELVLGDSLRQKIDEGVAHSTIGVVILSHAFFAKPWPVRELNGLTARLISGHDNAVIPIWHGLGEQDVLSYSAPLADLLAGDSADGVEALGYRIEQVLARRATTSTGGTERSATRGRDKASGEPSSTAVSIAACDVPPRRHRPDDGQHAASEATLRVDGAVVGNDRMRVQVCPSGCHYVQSAGKNLVRQGGRFGRAEPKVEYQWETSHCPVCGARLVRQCGRCAGAILAPVPAHCEFCGVPHPWAAERQSGRRTEPRKWLPDPKSKEESRQFARLLHRVDGRGELLIIEADVTQLDVDAIVSDDDVDGRMWSHIASEIKRQAGHDVETEAMEHGPFRQGSAWCGRPGALDHLKYIVHVFIWNRRGQTDKNLLRAGVRSALCEATKYALASLAVPAMGTDPAGVEFASRLDEVAVEIIVYLRQLPSEDRNAPYLSLLLVVDDHPVFEDLVLQLQRAISRGGGRTEAQQGRPPCRTHLGSKLEGCLSTATVEGAGTMVRRCAYAADPTRGVGGLHRGCGDRLRRKRSGRDPGPLRVTGPVCGTFRSSSDRAGRLVPTASSTPRARSRSRILNYALVSLNGRASGLSRPLVGRVATRLTSISSRTSTPGGRSSCS